MSDQQEYEILLEEVTESPLRAGVEIVDLQTDKGVVHCRLHRSQTGDAAIIWVGGAGGGLEGPAGGLYPRLAEILAPEGITSLRLDYRKPNYLVDCVLDVMVGIAYLESLNCQRIVLVGHSFGGAVVISAGASSPSVVGVVTLSSQTYGTGQVADLSPKALLAVHGTSDTVLPDSCTEDIYSRALEPKEMILYPGCGHGLDQCRNELDHDLLEWLRKVLLKKH